MENAADALRLAAWVLIFIMALSISMSSFAQARQSIDQILMATDRDYITTYVEQSKDTQRIVGAESIVPTIYRAYKENFKIRFAFLEGTGKPLYYRFKTEGTTISKEPVYIIDLEQEKISDEFVKEYIIKRILYGKKGHTDSSLDDNILDKLKDKIDFSISTTNQSYVVSEEGLYGDIKGNQYKEFIGLYFQEEVNGTLFESMANKTEKKVVTYKNI